MDGVPELDWFTDLATARFPLASWVSGFLARERRSLCRAGLVHDAARVLAHRGVYRGGLCTTGTRAVPFEARGAFLWELVDPPPGSSLVNPKP